MANEVDETLRLNGEQYTNGAISAPENMGGTDNKFANEDYFGGQPATAAQYDPARLDPLVTGYAFIIFTKIPSWVKKKFPNYQYMMTRNMKNFDGLADITMNTGGVTHGFSANETHTALSIQKEQGFTFTSNEYSGSPIAVANTYWVSGIRDPNTNIATYARENDMEYSAVNHTGELIYIATRPDANNVEKNIIERAVYYTNVMPTTINLGHFNHTNGGQQTHEVSIQFTGNRFHGAPVHKLAAEMLKKEKALYKFMTENDFAPTPAGYGGGGGAGGAGAGGAGGAG